MNQSRRCSTWVDVDLGAIRQNIRHFLKHSGVQVMAIVKANAYGHGAFQVASTAIEAGASWCGVARLEEALELRSAGIQAPILLLGYIPQDRLDEAIGNRISLTIWRPEQIEAISAASRRLGILGHVHLKVDTGMSRLGVQADEAIEMARKTVETPGIFLEGLYTHYARADELECEVTASQEKLFRIILGNLDTAGLRPPLVHAANSAAGLQRPSSFFNIVRAGIAIYGLQPSRDFNLPGEFVPALSWKAVLSHVKTLPGGRGISYGHTYTTQSTETIGTIAVGYGDGFRRHANNEVLVRGKRVPVVGRVCMDQMMVRLDDLSGGESGDEVVLIGDQMDERIPTEEVAERWQTISYEVVCGINQRVPRFY